MVLSQALGLLLPEPFNVFGKARAIKPVTCEHDLQARRQRLCHGLHAWHDISSLHQPGRFRGEWQWLGERVAKMWT